MLELDKIFERMPETPWENIGDEAVILNMESGCYYSLNELGRFIWENMDGSMTLNNILQKVLEEYEVGADEAKEDLSKIVEELLKENLARPVK